MNDDALARLARDAHRAIYDPATRRSYFRTASGWEALITPDQVADLRAWYALGG